MRVPIISGIIDRINNVVASGKGYSQSVVIEVPQRLNEDGAVLRKQHFFVVNIWSNKQDDSRFLKPEFKGAECNADCYLDGERWQGRIGFEYNNKLRLTKWLKDEEVLEIQKKQLTKSK